MHAGEVMTQGAAARRLPSPERGIFLWLLGAALVYVAMMLPQFADYRFGDDTFYGLGRAQRAVSDPWSIFEPSYMARFHPLHWLASSWIFRASGINPVGYGLAGILTHVFNAWLIFMLLDRLEVPRSCGVLSSVFFLFLSSQWQVVSEIGQFLRLGADLFLLASMVLFVDFLRSNRRLLFASSILVYLISFGFNEDAITVSPLLVLMIMIMPLNRRGFFKNVWGIIPYAGLTLLYGVLSYAVGTLQGVFLEMKWGTLERFLSLFKEFCHALFIPRREFGSWLGEYWIYVRVLPMIVILMIAVLCLLLGRQRSQGDTRTSASARIFVFGCLWLAVTGLPYSMRLTGLEWQNRYLYLPGIGVSMMVAAFFHQLWSACKDSGEGAKLSGIFRVFIGLSVVYIMTLNATTSVYMFHKTRSDPSLATRAEAPHVFSFVNKLRGLDSKVVERSMLVIEQSPIRVSRLEEILVNYHGAFPRKIVDSKDLAGMNQSMGNGAEVILYFSWRNGQWLARTTG